MHLVIGLFGLLVFLLLLRLLAQSCLFRRKYQAPPDTLVLVDKVVLANVDTDVQALMKLYKKHDDQELLLALHGWLHRLICHQETEAFVYMDRSLYEMIGPFLIMPRSRTTNNM